MRLAFARQVSKAASFLAKQQRHLFNKMFFAVVVSFCLVISLQIIPCRWGLGYKLFTKASPSVSLLILQAGCNGCTQHTFTYRPSSSCSHQFCYDEYNAHCRDTVVDSWALRHRQKTKNHAEAFILSAARPLIAIESTFNSGNENLLISDSERRFVESSQAVKKSIAIRTDALGADL